MDPRPNTEGANPGPSSLIIDLIPPDTEGDRALGRLLDATFPVPEGSHFFDDFPIWSSAFAGVFLREGRMARMGVYDGDQLVGCACARLAELKLGSARLKIALIGGVATLGPYQGHGFASRLVSIAASWAQERGAAAAVLWGSEHALYQRQGFELCGQQLRAKLAALAPAGSTPTIAVATGWTPALHACLAKRHGGLALGDEDRAWLEAHRNTKWFWTGDASAPTAYAALGRGIDLRGMVHEWGGERNALRAILARIQSEEPQAELLGPPWQFERYGISSSLATLEFLCMARVLDLPAVLACFPSNQPTIADLTTEAMHALFGPPTEAAPFPLPLWLWGLDAV